jgi:hypothetical protein
LGKAAMDTGVSAILDKKEQAVIAGASKRNALFDAQDNAGL